MKDMGTTKPNGDGSNARLERMAWALLVAFVIFMVFAIYQARPKGKPPAESETGKQSASTPGTSAASSSSPSARRLRDTSEVKETAEEAVSRRLNQFIQNRRELMRGFAKYLNVEAPAEMEKFFDVAQTGDWEDIQAEFAALRKLRESDSQPPGLSRLWGAVHETFGIIQTARDWPAQKLLDYGDAVLSSLRPGMVYVGGTDPGRFIPTLLNETGDGERHIILTQNALADNSYVDYVNFQYRDRMATLTPEESKKAFEDYLSDAQQRYTHDQNFPNEPRQLRPGEDIRMEGERVNVSGQIAVMSINELLFKAIMTKNPDMTFAMEQSFPLLSTYAQAAPLGPVMELRVTDEQNALNSQRAGQAVDYWRSTAQQFVSEPESDITRMAYGKMAAEQAALLLNRNFPAEAEQTFRFANEIAPTNPDTVFRYVDLLMRQNRVGDAIGVAQHAVSAAPNNKEFSGLLARLNTLHR
jgi:hypothetical protein